MLPPQASQPGPAVIDLKLAGSAACPCTCRYVPERLLHAYGTPRPIFMILLGLLSATVMAFNAYATLEELLPASILAGFAFGAHWSVMATLTSELFGLKSFASNYCLVQVRQGGFLWCPPP